ncbi:peptidyl-prolyl cis-trans isomerase FKBP7 isoform X3 [Brienomyrus brachyistius]|uniref:peptidyl-prolyl cis-trans isomerase FKBP7 isoform X3 n=1 Tax=Brienomyrus brachyistius TaxID=42636 RepID=UPI0020B304E4|nr:peptidyl-prolyl cis-trans isomerase FKBP7 isoform X3 [Brienomyrus brachyistius]
MQHVIPCHAGVVVMAVFMCLFLYLQLCSFWGDPAAAAGGLDEVQIEVLFIPEDCTRKSRRGDLMNAHYDGYLAEDGTKFYCSRSDKAGHPQWFIVGVGQIIRGLDLGMMGMCAGEKRKITIPPSLAFGEKGKDPLIPPNATVTFEVEVYSVSRGPRSKEGFMEIDLDMDRSLSKDEVRKHLKQSYEKDGRQQEEKFYDAIIADLFSKSDNDGDGEISAKEYNVYQHDEF